VKKFEAKPPMENTNVGVYADLVRFWMEKAMKEP
jgi:hypothetical protein